MINKFNIDQVFEHDFIIDSKIQDLFIEISKDSNPMHTIDAYAMKFGFENKIMHGNILNSFLSFFIGECLPIKNVVIQSQNIEFKKPVYIDSKIKLIALVEDIVESVNVVIFKFKFENINNIVVAKGRIQIGIL
jgi:3-hydroxybutyryl-CoA dehydratase